ncbi:hypothetical protein D7L56_13560 [Enterococcus faecalis]|nr:hypothetical protein [Enterococcus faecalis]EGO8397568.1 hypothetical protein [Enterococcus faecalis]EGO8481719.1 hypothetical protein [Enterococcus faecalis]EGO8541429.1 hypothetical protein [Enterococcus faecalis]EGO8842365.1 hypothetical protein [Enterococcus faecalis]
MFSLLFFHKNTVCEPSPRMKARNLPPKIFINMALIKDTAATLQVIHWLTIPHHKKTDNLE